MPPSYAGMKLQSLKPEWEISEENYWSYIPIEGSPIGTVPRRWCIEHRISERVTAW